MPVTRVYESSSYYFFTPGIYEAGLGKSWRYSSKHYRNFSLNRATRFLQNDNDLTTVMNIKFWIYKKIVRWHFTNIYQRSSRSLQKALEDGKMKAKCNLSFSYCPTALVCCPPSFLPFLTGSCQLSGLIEKNDKKDWNLTTLTEN